MPGSPAGRRGGERDDVGLLGVDQPREVPRRRRGAEVEHLPAVALEEVGDHLHADGVALLRAAADHRQPAVLRRRAHPRPERAEHGQRHRGGVVLAGDVELARRPLVADRVERRLEDAEVDVRHRHAGLQRAVHGRPGARRRRAPAGRPGTPGGARRHPRGERYDVRFPAPRWCRRPPLAGAGRSGSMPRHASPHPPLTPHRRAACARRGRSRLGLQRGLHRRPQPVVLLPRRRPQGPGDPGRQRRRVLDVPLPGPRRQDRRRRDTSTAERPPLPLRPRRQARHRQRDAQVRGHRERRSTRSALDMDWNSNAVAYGYQYCGFACQLALQGLLADVLRQPGRVPERPAGPVGRVQPDLLQDARRLLATPAATSSCSPTSPRRRSRAPTRAGSRTATATSSAAPRSRPPTTRSRSTGSGTTAPTGHHRRPALGHRPERPRRRLRHPGGRQGEQPTFSPDGTQMAWTRRRGPEGRRRAEPGRRHRHLHADRAAHVISATGRMPSFGGADVDAVAGVGGGRGRRPARAAAAPAGGADAARRSASASPARPPAPRSPRASRSRSARVEGRPDRRLGRDRQQGRPQAAPERRRARRPASPRAASRPPRRSPSPAATRRPSAPAR